MAQITIDHVTKYFGDAKGVDDAHIDIGHGEFFTLLGPSGCGKTTLLRTLAGFYQQEEGSIYFGEKCMDSEPAHKRDIGMVFQNYAIFPHLTVFENVAYGLRARKVSKQDIERRVSEALEVVELSAHRSKQPAQMSGGQQQRIALARAIVIHPGLLLMDEPLSNLDAKLRLKMRSEIRALQKRLNITTIYVTHDQEEALAVSDRIAVLNQGRIQQVGRPHEIYLNPVNRFVANFIGSTNFIDTEIMGYDPATKKANMRIAEQQVSVPLDRAYNGKALFSIRPEQLKLKKANTDSEVPSVVGSITEVTFLGEKVEYLIDLKNGQTVQVNDHAVSYSELRGVGQFAEVCFHVSDAVIFDEEGKEAIKSNGNISAAQAI
ncbi:ABC transporter ATP-binding protein [Paenibacillus paeoniae]|uniref:Spermidine/putrescine import ATP-binding protein PotA n=1 Tax=Paenibacillus paeoniae TaxID=2292705 RepID=A0A371PJ48_9BACL|nr:ABC transporter ATP-binding protein [Paenibacillus paeoniae]REK76173.1 ABC transporter ATP-binding protein [Paenibacillus paeoniae]